MRSGPENEGMIEVNGISKVYHVGTESFTAVSEATFQVPDGEFVAIVGHSGSGKSTLLSMIGGLTRPTSGSVHVDGEDLWAEDDRVRSWVRNQKIGFIFQFASLIPTLTSLDNVALPRMFDPRHRVSRQQYETARGLLELIGLADKLHAYPNALSGGQQRRVAIARALINSPGILLADEPTGDLDEETEAEVLRLLMRTVREQHTTLLMVTHSGDIPSLANRVLQMKGGVLQ
jgi:putative ABC transport system ATP-binding protein/lipoprotein-releasing system ATP-binding protein